MFNKRTIHKKDKWLNDWAGGDISDFTNLDVVKELMLQYYAFCIKQAHIYLHKYAAPSFFMQEKLDNNAKDISLRVLFDVAAQVSQGKYQESGKMEAYIRTFVERAVIRFLRFKNSLQQNLETLPPEHEREKIEDNSLIQYLADCQEEVMQSGVNHVIRNVVLLYEQKEYGKSLDELAAQENTTVGGIKSRLLLARRILFDCVEQKKQQDNA